MLLWKHLLIPDSIIFHVKTAFNQVHVSTCNVYSKVSRYIQKERSKSTTFFGTSGYYQSRRAVDCYPEWPGIGLKENTKCILAKLIPSSYLYTHIPHFHYIFVLILHIYIYMYIVYIYMYVHYTLKWKKKRCNKPRNILKLNIQVHVRVSTSVKGDSRYRSSLGFLQFVLKRLSHVTGALSDLHTWCIILLLIASLIMPLP